MRRTIEEMLADGMNPAEIHRMVEAEVQKQREKDAAARKALEEQRKKDAEAAKREKRISDYKENAAYATVKYLYEAGAIDEDMMDEHISMVMECLEELANNIIADRKMLSLVKKVFGE